MYRRIVVPLDGSELAETVLPFVQALAGHLKAEVDLLRVINLSHAFPYTPETYLAPDTYEQVLEADEIAAKEYLDALAARLQSAGLSTTTKVVAGFPAGSIIDEAGGDDSTFIAMTTHGRSGLARFALGSVAELVLRGADTPVLLVRPLANVPDAIDHIVLPLDGSTFGEKALPVVEAIAPALGATVKVLQVVHAGGEPEAQAYLDAVATRLRKVGVQDVSVHLKTGGIADGIIDFADHEHLDLIVMATHGRSGPGRWVFGSVADKVLHAETVPILLVRAKK